MLSLDVDYKKELLALAKFSKDKYQQEEVLVKFFGWFEDSENLFISMEYFELGDLEKHITESVTEDDVKDIATDVLNGLRIMHNENFSSRPQTTEVTCFKVVGQDRRLWNLQAGSR
jgi:serine/threonine protein kinase